MEKNTTPSDIRDETRNAPAKRNRSHILTIRIPGNVKQRLDKEAEFNSVTVNALISSILNRHTQWDKFASDIGFASVSKDLLKSLLDYMSEDAMKEIALTTSKGMKDAMIYINGKLDVSSFFSTVDLWLRATNIVFRHLEVEGQIGYVIQHGLSEKWSIYFLAMMNAILNELGYRATNQHHDNDNLTFTIERV